MRLSRFTVVLGVLVLFFAASADADVLKVVVNDAIHPVTAEYIGRALQTAAANHDQAVLIEINTPGGLVDSTRDIIEKIIASPVPVIIYVTPSGSRAASAGFFILESADVCRHGARDEYRSRTSCDSGRQDGRRNETENGKRPRPP